MPPKPVPPVGAVELDVEEPPVGPLVDDPGLVDDDDPGLVDDDEEELEFVLLGVDEDEHAPSTIAPPISRVPNTPLAGSQVRGLDMKGCLPGARGADGPADFALSRAL